MRKDARGVNDEALVCCADESFDLRLEFLVRFDIAIKSDQVSRADPYRDICIPALEADDRITDLLTSRIETNRVMRLMTAAFTIARNLLRAP